MSRTLSAPVTVSFDYTRSVGPVIGRFLTGLRDGQLVGARLSDGRVVVPPPEFDPVTHRATADFVELPETGTVTSWTWVSEPVAGQPFDRPFAFALVTIDGADAPLLHAVDVASPDQISTGMKVRARWAAERTGAITDLVFEPDTGTASATAPAAGEGAVTGIVTPVSLDYTYAASPEESAFFRGLSEGRIVGQRCPTCEKVYVPPRPACPTDGVPTVEEIELSHTGTVTTFCIVNVPFLGQKIAPPYVSAYILLDGADIALQHLILDIPVEEIRMGLRVKAVWKPRDEWGTTIENISHFAPADEPDADFDTYKHHL
ncbi:Zn-ribbon domain-containing OB-fold protein [Pimelobacter simplex]|uniref:Zn-ribbon domain-containing OB-fold protein n=1 Tax=Nocardioides simplex TaxID=2045 RepID=UPI0021505759|nr:OB-fold nucleic acid binding domain-containing protein [Pimelobacter simplex]UUW88213.1 OB-fold domain-containing protein [Pimelobacter simplex]UUW97718.1 OB-fold domain-containing protein [Pimelobacter simplex]